MKYVELAWTEAEALATRYIGIKEVPDDFGSWDEDLQDEYLRDDLPGAEPLLSSKTIDGEVIDTNIEEWRFTEYVPPVKPSHWDVDPDYPVENWQEEVANDDTRLGYAAWVANQREMEEGA